MLLSLTPLVAITTNLYDLVDRPRGVINARGYRNTTIYDVAGNVRGVIDRPSFSFSTYMLEKPGGPTEIHDWVDTIFKELRQLERRLLMGHASAALGGPIRAAPRTR